MYFLLSDKIKSNTDALTTSAWVPHGSVLSSSHSADENVCFFFLHVFPGHPVRHRRPHHMEKAHVAAGKRHGRVDR